MHERVSEPEVPAEPSVIPEPPRKHPVVQESPEKVVSSSRVSFEARNVFENVAAVATSTTTSSSTNSSIETPPPVAVSVLNRKFSEIALTSQQQQTTAPILPPSAVPNKPLVTFTNQDANSAPPVRRKSSELSNTMKSRLEAFIAPTGSAPSLPEVREKAPDHAPEPDEKFHEKLQTFRKISEGPKPEEANVQRKPKLSYSSLIGVSDIRGVLSDLAGCLMCSVGVGPTSLCVPLFKLHSKKGASKRVLGSNPSKRKHDFLSYLIRKTPV